MNTFCQLLQKFSVLLIFVVMILGIFLLTLLLKLGIRLITNKFKCFNKYGFGSRRRKIVSRLSDILLGGVIILFASYSIIYFITLFFLMARNIF